MNYAELKRKLELMTDEQLNTDVTVFLSADGEFLPIYTAELITSGRFDDCCDVFDPQQLILATAPTCVICGDAIKPQANGWAHGHNAAPVRDGQCCDVCNHAVVLPARVGDA